MARFRAVVVIHPPRVRGQSGGRPPLDGHRERFLHRLFGDVDVAEEADQIATDRPDSCRKISPIRATSNEVTALG